MHGSTRPSAGGPRHHCASFGRSIEEAVDVVVGARPSLRHRARQPRSAFPACCADCVIFAMAEHIADVEPGD